MEKERKLSFDLIRSLAAVAIVVIHVTWQSYGRLADIGYYNWLLGAMTGWMMMWGTGNFLMISGGLLLGSRKSGVIDFYKRRLEKIVIPLLFWNLVYFFVAGYWQNSSMELWVFWDNLWKMGNQYHLYFLNVMLGLYAITPWLKKWVINKNLKVIVPILALLSFGYIWGVAFWGWEKWENLFVWFIPYIGYFLAGYWLGNMGVMKNRVRWLIVAGSLLLISGLISKELAFVFDTHEKITIFTNRLSLGVVGAAMIIYRVVTSLENKSLEKYRKWIMGVSNLSMGMFLVHPLWIEIFKRNWWWNHFMQEFYVGWLVVNLVTVTGLAIGTTYLLKKIPYLKAVV